MNGWSHLMIDAGLTEMFIGEYRWTKSQCDHVIRRGWGRDPHWDAYRQQAVADLNKQRDAGLPAELAELEAMYF